MSTVKFPAVLRANVGGVRELQVDGATIGQVLDSLAGTYPALRDQLYGADGELNRFINVYVNGQDVRYLDGRATPVADADEVRLLPAMAGGAAGDDSATADDDDPSIAPPGPGGGAGGPR